MNIDSEVHALIMRCKDLGLRKTKALEELFFTFLEVKKPMNLVDISSSARMKNQCDKATVFRMLQRLQEHGLVRRLGLHERAAYFTLIHNQMHHDYIICTDCGKIEPIQAACPVHALEKKIQQESGYQNLYHELEFFGTCPACVAT